MAKFSGEHVVCIICGRSGATEHHIKSQKSYPHFKNAEWNRMPLAHQYHVEVHLIGMISMAIKYPQVEDWLFKNGWEYEPYAEKWVHDLE